MKQQDIQEFIERAYAEYQADDGKLSQYLWDNLDNNNISPAALWDTFNAGFTPIDIYINQEIINNGN